MATTWKVGQIEVATMDADGCWEHLGDFATEAEAREAMASHARGRSHEVHFGWSTDPASGHYEHGCVIYPGGTVIDD